MKILGHSVHPFVIVFPLGLLATAVVFDVIYLVFGGREFAAVAYWMIAAGIIGGLVAAFFGWADWFKIPTGTRAKSIGIAHGLVNSGVLLLFAISWYLRMGAPERPSTMAFVFAIAGAVFALLGGWLGGELVERLGVGVHTGANVNAPSSLVTSVIPNQTHATKSV